MTGDDPDRLCENLRDLLPLSPNQPYDMKKVITSGRRRRRLHGGPRDLRPAGHLRLRAHRRPHRGHRRQPAPDPRRACSTSTRREKAARFVRTCDAFNVPIVTFVDVPGFMPGRRPGVRRDHPPRREAPLRVLRGDGAAHLDHHAQGLRRRLRRHELQVDRRGPRLRLADGRARGHGRPGAVEIVHRRDLAAADDPAALRAELIEDYEEHYATPYIAAERGFIDDVIDPADTRRVLSRSLDLLRGKREDLPKRKHGNVPL